MSAARYRDWQSRLAAFLEERRSMPFAWGGNDCCTFACSAVEAQTGHDPAKGLRGHRTAQAAAETLREHGRIRKLADARLGPAIAPAMAQMGDVGLAVLDGRKTLVVAGGSGWVAPGELGVVWLPLEVVEQHAWRAV